MPHLPVAYTNVRSPVSTTVHYSDATPAAGGYVSGRLSRELAQTLHGHVEFKGRHARLDWRDADFKARGWADYSILVDAEAALAGVLWSSSGKLSFRQIEHINIQEARAFKSVLKHHAGEGWRDE